jgi:phage shock protein A
MTGSRLIGLVLAVAALGAVAYFVFPQFRTKVDDAIAKHGGWDEASRRKDPVGFVNYSIKKLEDNIAKFDNSRIDIREGKNKLDKMKAENEQKIKFNANNLNEFKAAYKSATEGGKWPVSVAGRSYTEAELKSQVELALSEKATFANVAGQLEKGCKDLEAKEFELVNRITESKSNLSALRTQAEILKANKLTAETEKMMSEVQEVLARNDAVNAEVKIRTTEELMKDAASAAKATPKADEFLKS